MLIRVDAGDVVDGSPFMNRLAAFCVQRSIAQRFVGTDGHVLLSGNTKTIRLHAGMKSLSTALDMEYEPTLVNDYKPLPYRFLSKYFTNGYDASRVAQAIGGMYTEAAIRDEIANVVSRSEFLY